MSPIQIYQQSSTLYKILSPNLSQIQFARFDYKLNRYNKKGGNNDLIFADITK